MKNKLFFTFSIVFSLTINAQIYTPSGVLQGTSTSNNVGIGTNNATTKLTIQAGPDGYATPLKAISILGPNSPANANSAQDLSWDFAAAGSSAIRSYRGSGFDTYLQFMTNSQFGGNAPQARMHIGGDGNIGIGTTNPNTKLHIIGTQTIEDSTYPAIDFTGGTSNGTVGAFGDNIRMINFSANGTTTVQGNGNIDIKTEGGYNVIFGTAAIERMRILSNGNIGIGTAVPDEKLTVKGKIHTQEIRVDLLGPLVPDYVFAKDYKLKSLQEVEDYIKQNSHLPEIPSAKEIEKNGLMLAEMNMSLLKKIEELTLYSIEQNKKTETQAKKIEAQSKEIETLKDLVLRVAKIENDLAKKK